VCVELNRKAKGDLAELKIAADLRGRGYKIAFPYGEDWDYDLILCRSDGRLERVQVKHGYSDGNRLPVKCCSASLTNGRVRQTKHYTARMIDWLAVWDRSTDRCFYVPASELGSGMNVMHLRLSPCRNGQFRGIRSAEDYEAI
jgi:hypothetical protein